MVFTSYELSVTEVYTTCSFLGTEIVSICQGLNKHVPILKTGGKYFLLEVLTAKLAMQIIIVQVCNSHYKISQGIHDFRLKLTLTLK